MNRSVAMYSSGVIPALPIHTGGSRGRHAKIRGTRYVIRSRPNIPAWDERSNRYAKISVEVQNRTQPAT